MSHVGESLALDLGYTPLFTYQSECADMLRKLFGDFSLLQIHVAQFTPESRTVTVTGDYKGLREIHEHFTGIAGSVHRTKGGAPILLSFCPRGMSIALVEFTEPAPDGASRILAYT